MEQADGQAPVMPQEQGHDDEMTDISLAEEDIDAKDTRGANYDQYVTRRVLRKTKKYLTANFRLTSLTA